MVATLNLVKTHQRYANNSCVIHIQLKEWQLWMQAGGMAARTIKFRMETIDLFARRTGANPLTCDWRPIAQFLSNDEISRATKVNYYATLKSWFDYLARTGQRADSPLAELKKPTLPRRTPRPITTHQLSLLLSSGIYRRTRMMILLAAYQGLRVHEIAKVRGEHFEGDRMRVIGKGQVDSTLPVHPMVAAYAARFPEVGLWFPSPDDPNKPIRGKSVGATIGQAMHRAGFKATAHQLRHWFGTETLRASGGNLRTTQELMRHASPTSTAIYTLIGSEQHREALTALPVPMHVERSRSLVDTPAG